MSKTAAKSWLRAAIFSVQLGACASLGDDYALYDQMRASDVAMAARLMQDTLERAPDGAIRGRVNPKTGHRGAIAPTRTYLSENGHFCRAYREELVIGQETGQFQNTACRTDDGRWVWL